MDKNSIEKMIEFMYNKCLRCDYKECKKKKKNIEELESALQKIKNDELHEIENITNIRI